MWRPDPNFDTLGARSRFEMLLSRLPKSLRARLGFAMMMFGFHEGYMFVRMVAADLWNLAMWPVTLLMHLLRLVGIF